MNRREWLSCAGALAVSAMFPAIAVASLAPTDDKVFVERIMANCDRYMEVNEKFIALWDEHVEEFDGIGVDHAAEDWLERAEGYMKELRTLSSELEKMIEEQSREQAL